MFFRRFVFVLLLCVSAACARQRPPVVSVKFPPPPPNPTAFASIADFYSLRPAPDRVAQLKSQIDRLIWSYDLDHAQWGINVVSMDRNEVLYERNSRIPIIPASNMKIVTAAAALLRLGPEFRYETKLIADGPIVNGRLRGNLLILGSGDPSISTRMQTRDPLAILRDWADDLHRQGIRRIEGSIVGLDHYFDDQRVAEGWPSTNAPYAAQVSALQFNENVIAVRVRPGRSGRAASVRLYPDTRYLRVRNSVFTRRGHANRFVAYRMDDTNTIVLRGRIGSRDPVDVRYITIHEPAAYFAAILRETLEKRGIRSGGSRRGFASETELLRTHPEQFQVLLTHDSPPLGTIVSEMMKASQNLIADTLAKTVSAVDDQTGSFQGAQQSIRRILERLGVVPHELVMQDGSGLSSYNTLTANLLTQILRGMAKQTSFDDFYRSFPVAGVDGTLRNRMTGTIAEGRVHAKTGYIGAVRSLSGYVRTSDGEQLAFALITNHFDQPLRGVDSAHEEICSALAQFSRR
jgi:serine-type D-Ala-D-Ala carboxypeptidase/endopeptidase (penicillin-binding protein 4)